MLRARMPFIEELKRRNVFRVGIAYAIATWVLLQITEVVAPILGLPDWAPKLIFVILAVGFVPALIFAWAFELTPEGIKREKDVVREESITHDTGRKLDYAIIAVLLLAVGLLLIDKFYFGEGPEAGVGEIVATGQSIAVLPFVNISSDQEQEYFSDGITEEILNSLAAVKELKVAGRTSSFAFKGQNDDLRRIGDLLGVEHILEGSVRKSGRTVRITAQLVQVEDGFHLWSDTYDRELTDVFAIQDEIANEILKQLKARLLDEEQAPIVSQRTEPEVYDLYLLAKQRIYGRTRQTLELAVELLDRAISIDPDYAPAHAQRGIAIMLLSDRDYGTIPDAEAIAQGKRFIDAALEKDQQLAEAWAGLGLYYAKQPSGHEQAADALTKALSINPNLIDASNWLQIVLSESGDPRGALQILEQMMQRDPLYGPGFANTVNTLNDFGHEEKARALIDRFRNYDPNEPILLNAAALHNLTYGRSAEGFRLAERAHQLRPNDRAIHFSFSLGLVQTLQIERLAEEGLEGFRVFALDLLGRRDDAIELALSLSREGYLQNLFGVYTRADRSRDLVNFLEERWPGLDAFSADYPQNEYGYGLMAEVALAYSRTGNNERFDEALLLVEKAISKLSDQGIDNCFFMFERAKYLALAGDYDAAINQLELAVDRGLRGPGLSATITPVFEPIRGDPRFLALRESMMAKVNVDREDLGMGPIDPTNEPWF